MENKDLLFTAGQSSDELVSASVWEYDTLKIHKSYKNGGIEGPKCVETLEKDYRLCTEMGKRFLNLRFSNDEDVLEDVRLTLPSPANCLTVCPEYTFLAVGIGCKLYVWHLSSGKLLAVQKRHNRQITCVKFSDDGIFLLVGGEDGLLVNYCMSDLVGMQPTLEEQNSHVVEPMFIKNDHSLEIQDIHTGILGNRARCATVSADKSCYIYNIVSGQLFCNLVCEESLSSVVYSTFYVSLFVGMNSGNIKQFNLEKEPLPKTIDESSGLVFQGHTDKVVCLALNMNETILATGSIDCHIYTWNIQSRCILKSVRHGGHITNLKFTTSLPSLLPKKLKPKVVIKSLDAVFNETDLVAGKSQSGEVVADAFSSKSEEEKLLEEIP